MKTILNKRNYFLLILYGIVLLAVMVGTGNLFGSQEDWLGQHIVFPDTFRQAFYESGQLIPNLLFEIGGGQNVFHFVYYGFLSPGILLSYLLPFVDMTVYIICLCIVSYLASGILVYRFLNAHFGETEAFVATLLFMALPPMTYHFHHHVMFVWYMPYFISGLIGLDRYFDKKKSGLFIIGTFGMILTNYYFSVGGLIFLFIYAVYRILQKQTFSWKSFIWEVLKITALFVIPVLMSGFVLLPTAYALFTNGRGGASTNEIWKLIIPEYKQYFFNPNSMGISAIMLVAVFGNLTCKTKRRADSFLNAISLLVLVCPLFLYALNGMLYVRGKVLIAFTVLFLYDFCLFLERLQKKEIQIKQSMLLAVGMVLLCILLRRENWRIGLILLAEIVLLCCLRTKRKAWYICPVVVAIIASCAVNTSEKYVSVSYYEEMYSDEIEELMKEAEEGIYRSNVAYREKYTANKTYGENFYGTSVYSSTANSLYQKFYETYMGNNEKYRNCFMTTGAENELYYTFMGTRYIIGEEDPGFCYEQVKEGAYLNLYENKYAYPLAYKSIQTMSEEQFDEMEFPYSTEYLMSHTVTADGAKSDFESRMRKCDVDENYTFVQKEDENYVLPLREAYRNKIVYLAFDITNEGEYRNKKDISISINGIQNKLTDRDWLYYNGNTTFEYVIPLEECAKLTVEITKGKYNIQNLKMYTSDMIYMPYEEADDLKIDEYAGEILCSTNAKEGEYLVTSIPYDKGFTAKINGEKTDVEVVNKAFVGVKLKEGKNDIVIQYNSPLFKEGIIVSVIGIIFMILVIWKERLHSIWKKHREVIMYLVFGALTTVVSLFTYFVCTSLFLDTDNAVQLQIANVISWIASVTFAYVTNRKYVFQSHHAIVKEMVKFYLSRLGTLVLDMLLMYLLVTVGKFSDGVVKIGVQIVVIIANYVFGKLLVFRGNTNENISSSTMLQ